MDFALRDDTDGFRPVGTGSRRGRGVVVSWLQRAARRRYGARIVPPARNLSWQMRHLVDALGREWLVYERESPAQSPSPGHQSLVFDADGIVRRLWRYPAAWAELPDDALLGLMEDPSGVRGQAAR